MSAHRGVFVHYRPHACVVVDFTLQLMSEVSICDHWDRGPGRTGQGQSEQSLLSPRDRRADGVDIARAVKLHRSKIPSN